MSATMPKEYSYSDSFEEILMKDDRRAGSSMRRHKRFFKQLFFLIAFLAAIKNFNSFSNLEDTFVEIKVVRSHMSSDFRELNTFEETAGTEETKSNEQLQFPQIQVDSSSKVIFYHIYIPVKEPENALRIIKEQLWQMKDKKVTLLYNTVGDPTPLSTTQMDEWCAQYGFSACHHLQHLDSAQEEATLQPLHDFCSSHPSIRVGYMHNKGSYHESVQNENWRYLMTEALVREECWETDGSKCNACGLFLTTDIGLYFAGNMWTVDCSYVNQLVPPREFEARSRVVLGDALLRKEVGQLEMHERNLREIWYAGIGRYANEWWVASHPSVRPCDFSPSIPGYSEYAIPTPRVLQWIIGLGSELRAMNSTLLKKFQPRAPGTKFNWGKAQRRKVPNRKKEYYQLPGKIHKWVEMYEQLPDEDSWVWEHYPDGVFWKQKVQEHGLSVLDIVQPINRKIANDMSHIRLK